MSYSWYQKYSQNSLNQRDCIRKPSAVNKVFWDHYKALFFNQTDQRGILTTECLQKALSSMRHFWFNCDQVQMANN